MDESTDTPARTPEQLRRLQTLTAFYGVVGLVVGVAMPLLVTAVVIAVAVVNRWSSDLGRVAAIVLLCGFLTGYSTYGTCWKAPVAPRVIAIGMLAGGLAAFVTAYFVPGAVITRLDPRGSGGMIAFGLLLATAAQSSAALRCGTIAVRRHLGLRQLGIGRTCATCGYDLSATDDHWPCPECGGRWRFERSAAAAGIR